MDKSRVLPTPPRPGPCLFQVFPTCHLIRAFLGHLVIVTAPGPGNIMSPFCALLLIHLLSVSPLDYKLGMGGFVLFAAVSQVPGTGSGTEWALSECLWDE